jgi:hypothetical protein
MNSERIENDVANTELQTDLRREPLESKGERVDISRPEHRESIATLLSQELPISRQTRQEGVAEGCRYPPGPLLVALADLEGTGRPPRKHLRNRRPLPPQETRDWLTPNETALALGCSVATVHRMRRGLIPGIEPLPCSQYGRKFVFRKASLARWQERN